MIYEQHDPREMEYREITDENKYEGDPKYEVNHPLLGWTAIHNDYELEYLKKEGLI